MSAYREAVRLHPEEAGSHASLGPELAREKEFKEAIADFCEAVRLKPDSADAHRNLGNALKEHERYDQAIVEFREAVRLEPDHAERHFDLARGLRHQGQLDEAIDEYREAIRLEPENAKGHFELAEVLHMRGNSDEAIDEFREAVRLRPEDAEAHSHLAVVLFERDRLDEAIAEFREVIRIQPDNTLSHSLLGRALSRNGQHDEAVIELRRGEATRPAARDEKGAAIALDIARKLHDRKQYAVAARFWPEAFEADPKLAEDRQAQHRYTAACSVLLAAAGKGEDDPKPNETAKAKLRRQAFEWLEGERKAWVKVLLTGEEAERRSALEVLERWQSDPDLASIRDEAELARLPEAERVEWEGFWKSVDLLRRQTGVSPP